MVDINLGDADAWDDSALVSSWNEALQEYKKYHSIHAKGQKLSDVLTTEELKLLSTNGIDIEKPNDDNDEAPGKELDEEIAPMIETEDAPTQHGEIRENALLNSKSPTAGSGRHVPAALPQVLLNSVKDEGVRNLMMSWYWAGYYTGLHEGQQSSKIDD